MLKVLSDILLAIDAGDLSALVLLDMSAAFDTVDYTILLRRLKVSYRLGETVLHWFETYLHARVHQKNKGCEIELSGLPICFTGRYITAVKIISLLKVI